MDNYREVLTKEAAYLRGEGQIGAGEIELSDAITAALAEIGALRAAAMGRLACNPADVQNIPESARIPCAMLAAILNLDPERIWAQLSSRRNAALQARCDALEGALREWRDKAGTIHVHELRRRTDALLTAAPAAMERPADCYAKHGTAAPGQPCAACAGSGEVDVCNRSGDPVSSKDCPACGGTGRQA